MATPEYASVGYRAKTQFNENSKVQAFNENFPELNHNSLLAWQKAGSISKMFSVIMISDNNGNQQIRKRFEFTRPYITRSAKSVVFLHSTFKSKLSRILSTLYTLDFISVYLAMLYGRDPGDDALLDKLKRYIARKT